MWSRLSRFDPLLILLILGLWAILAGPLQAATQPGVSDSPMERLRLLEKEIARHDRLYFEKASPEITDREYDRLVAERERLRELLSGSGEGAEAGTAERRRKENPDTELIRPDREHRVPMLSLRKARGEGGLRDFHRRVSRAAGGRVGGGFVIEPKFDGVAVSLVYERGRFSRALSRGDGREGEDLTRRMQAIGGFPLSLPIKGESGLESLPEYLELRGEIYVAPSRFEAVNRRRESRGEPAYSTPRNLAAGTLQLEAEDVVASRGLELVVFGYGLWEPEADEPLSQSALFSLLTGWGFPVPDWEKAEGRLDFLERAVREVAARVREADLPADGLVVKVNDRALQKAMGTGSAFPHWALACKFEGPTGESRIRRIRFQVGRSGRLSAVAEVDPVDLGGRIVERINLHHADHIVAQDIRQGDPIRIELAGDSIPVITDVIRQKRAADSQPFEPPVRCPACGAELEGKGANLACSSPYCRERMRERIRHFAACMDIRGLGERTVATLQEAGFLESIPDLYALQRNREALIPLLGSGRSKALLREISLSRSASFERILLGLGLPGVGRVTAGAMAEQLQGLSDLLPLSPPSEGVLAVLPSESRAALMDPDEAAFWETCIHGLLEAGIGQAGQ
jgi:DNA ligase (NAD+)